MQIEFISDYVCPYCLVAKEALKKALEQAQIDAQIEWLPFELTEEPKPRVDTYHDEVRKSHYQVLVEPCKKLALDMKLPPNIVPRPYTRLAFEGWFYACERGQGDLWNDRMYRAYFIDEQDIGDIQVLTKIAEEIGLDDADFRQALQNGTYTEREKNAVRHTKETYQVRGVPSIYVNGNKIEIHDFTVEEMVAILQENNKDQSAGFCCGEDGCF